MPGRRVIVHAGFHKTGTTTVQKFLRANGKHIYPRCALVLPGRLRGGAARMAVRYSRFQTGALLDEFGRELHSVLSAITIKNRNLLIADENLSGRMPGREGQIGYPEAPALLARAEDVICDVFGAETDVVFHFSTRASDDWLHSTYRHNLRVSRLIMDMDEYKDAFAIAGGLEHAVESVREKVVGTVQSSDLSDMRDDHGPAQPLVDLMALPPHLHKRLTPHPAMNIGPKDDLIEDLLALNRAGLSDEALKTAKTSLLRKARSDDG